MSSATFDSRGTVGTIELGASFALGDYWQITPLVGAQYAELRQDAFTETGAYDFSYRVHDTKATARISYVGARFSGNFVLTNGLSVGPHLGLRYENDHDAGEDASHSITFSTDHFGQFTQVGQNKGSNTQVASIGLGLKTVVQSTISLDYLYSDSDFGHEKGGQLSFSWFFLSTTLN